MQQTFRHPAFNIPPIPPIPPVTPAPESSYVTPGPPPAEHPLAAARRIEANTFTDSEGYLYTVTKGDWRSEGTLTLKVSEPDAFTLGEAVFFAKDAVKIIALIAEAAAE